MAESDGKCLPFLPPSIPPPFSFASLCFRPPSHSLLPPAPSYRLLSLSWEPVYIEHHRSDKFRVSSALRQSTPPPSHLPPPPLRTIAGSHFYLNLFFLSVDLYFYIFICIFCGRHHVRGKEEGAEGEEKRREKGSQGKDQPYTR